SGFDGVQKDLIHILHRVQAKFGYIPPEAVAQIARRLKISPNEIYGVLTFYRAFSLEPRGEHVVTVCLGTACHVRGGVLIVEEMERRLGVKAGRTTPDKKFTLETVNCLGCCAIGPVVVVDGKYHSHVNLNKVEPILKEYRESG
ncbi:MAG: NAD(P)H-dependent oxidoreductase subunit E, partial [Candidatus Aminicenantes bacterium]|nr:NAD(P)H-dependent oxidoreductase subunit E [Candidatus Aminicenantes bacterium]